MVETELHRFTFHVDFLAADEKEALGLAEAYSTGLTVLRPEVDGYTARVSAGGDWSQSLPVYCGAPGPDTSDVCIKPAGEHKVHRGPLGEWTDDEVPHAPDTIEDLW